MGMSKFDNINNICDKDSMETSEQSDQSDSIAKIDVTGDFGASENVLTETVGTTLNVFPGEPLETEDIIEATAEEDTEKTDEEALEKKEELISEVHGSDSLFLSEIKTLREEIIELKLSLKENVQDLKKDFKNKIEYSQFREEHINKLHQELQDYRRDLYSKITVPYIKGFIRLHDYIGKVVEAIKRKDLTNVEPEYFIEKISDFQDDIEVILAQDGIDIYREIDENFNPKRQTAVKTEKTKDETLIGKVSLSLRPGFQQDGKIIEKERVIVYK